MGLEDWGREVIINLKFYNMNIGKANDNTCYAFKGQYIRFQEVLGVLYTDLFLLFEGRSELKD